jgi:hypothetical protein
MGLQTNLKILMGQRIGALPNATAGHIRGLLLAQSSFTLLFKYTDFTVITTILN